MSEERRKRWFLGVVPESWAAIIIAILATVFGYGVLTNKVAGTEEKVAALKSDTAKSIDDLKSDLTAQITQLRDEQRRDFDRLILLIQRNHTHD